MSENKTEQIQIPLTELIKIRRNKVLAMREKGIDSYPYKYEYSHKINELLDKFDELSENETSVKITGRIMLKRKMGKTFFADLRDSSERIQIYVRKDALGDDLFDLFNSTDLGDIIG
ncbi:MAG: lysine--tRNA ligase, partial [Candidatus Zixiibacteriota bacterium]